MDISSDKQGKSHTRRLEHRLERETLRDKLDRKCNLWNDRDETVNHIISEYSKLTQKEFKTKHYWGQKLIHWE